MEPLLEVLDGSRAALVGKLDGILVLIMLMYNECTTKPIAYINKHVKELQKGEKYYLWYL